MNNKNSKKKNPSIITQGYTKYGNQNDDQKSAFENKDPVSKAQLKAVKKAKNYPKGYFSFFFICLASLAVFLISFLTKTQVIDENNNSVYYHLVWQDSLSLGAGAGFLFNMFWWFWRQNFALRMRYTSRQMLDIYTYKQFRERKNWVIQNYYNINVKSFEEYEDFCINKKKSTALMFYISTGIFAFLFVIAIILSLTTVKGAHYVVGY
ncbi:MAG: hypothetical protein HUJ42_01335 [Malacoplasma sp.]|nr:hypothetical protein [Malacoplasma sp.]